MALEAATYVDGLVASNPVGATDPKSQGDDHIRLIKSVLKASFPGLVGPWKLVQGGLTVELVPEDEFAAAVRIAATSAELPFLELRSIPGADGRYLALTRAGTVYGGFSISLDGLKIEFDPHTSPAVVDMKGAGSPEGSVTAGRGSTYRRTDGGAGTCFYVKESASGNTGWVGK